MKLTSVDGNYIGMLVISFISALVGTLLFPLAGTIVMFILIVKATDADFFPDAVLMVIVSQIVSIGLMGAIASFFG